MTSAAATREPAGLSEDLLRQFACTVGDSGLIVERSQLQTYECDGLTAIRTVPAAVLLPRSRDEVQAIIRLCAEHKIPFVARGAGTGLRAEHCPQPVASSSASPG